ncbi:MAG: BON domain-containing protein [Acidobacteria bacterium]|nr:BON domain-containing protein [Acidobacteriota bacterium]
MKRLAAFLLGAALVALAAACDNGGNTNTNANANANLARNNNLAVNANTNANSNANTSGNYNAKITKEEYEKDKERYGREAKGAGETIGSGLEDGWLWVKTKGELATVDDLRDSTINVDVTNAVVTLRGSVATAAQKTKAEQAAKSVSGVKSVTDKLTVSASGNTNANNSNSKANANKK